MTSDERDQLEGDFVYERIIQLECAPIRGSFDVTHLKQINKHLFQDFPSAGLTNVNPGEFRAAAPADQDWIKNRALSTANASYVVAYSRMDDAARERLETVLTPVKPNELSRLSKDEFSSRIAGLYAELDYLHPFADGNSRTLRSFTRQLARESGYDLDWTRLGQTPQGRDTLYVARDLSVNRIAKPQLKDFATVRNVDHTELILAGNRDLETLLPGLIRPLRAIVFERAMSKQLSDAEALQAHPELQGAFMTVREASKYLAGQTAEVAAQRAGMAQIVERVQRGLNAGEILFGQVREPLKARAQEISGQGRADKGLDRYIGCHK